MVDKKFIGLDKPDITRFESYLPTAFSSELTLLQKVNKIIQDLNRSFDLTNEMVDYLNRFIESFDEKLYETLEDVLNVWVADGRLADIVRVAISEEVIEARTDYLGKKYVNLKERLDDERKEVILARGGAQTLRERLNESDAQLAQTDTLIKNAWIDVTDERFGAVGDGYIDASGVVHGTDNSVAIRKAIEYMCSLAKYKVGVNGWRSFMPTLYFPSGRYVISEKGTLNCVGEYLEGYNIKGGGYLNTELIYSYTPTLNEVDDYLLTNGGENWFGRSYVEDLTIRGNGKNKFWGIKSRQGAPQANRFRRVAFVDLLECVTVDYGSANANADLFRFDSCNARNISHGGWVFGVKDSRISQSVVHSFNDCDFENISGTCLYFKAGGAVDIRGGSWIVNPNGRVIHCDDNTGTGIGRTNSYYTFYGTKFEWIHKDLTDTKLDYYPLYYNSSQAKIKFVNCNFGQLQTGFNQLTHYNMGYMGGIGSIKFEDCYIPNKMKVKIMIVGSESRNAISASVEFINCILEKQLSDTVEVEFLNNAYSTGRNPTVLADGCRSYSKEEPVNVHLFKEFGSRYTTAKRQTYTYTNGDTGTLGLPTITSSSESSKITTFKLPLGSILRKVRIIFLGISGSTVFNIDVTNFNQTQTFVTGSHAQVNGVKAFQSDDLYYQINTEEKRLINVIGSSGVTSVGGTNGYIEIEYD